MESRVRNRKRDDDVIAPAPAPDDVKTLAKKNITYYWRLVGSGWGAGAKTLRIAILSLVYSAAEYCAPVWCRSAHTCLIDSVLNDALRIVTGCLLPLQRTTYLYSQASSQLSFADWERHFPWLTMDL